ncbi:hypothetical protein B0H14DRAFT_3654160 [Mycena olivaceomarginata]|nr:hypothetical protein B0H14DRAFT_3654160 [Mycena olivaceomarginata]
MAEYTKLPFDESFYDLTEEDLAFIKAQSGIEDLDTLKQHIRRKLTRPVIGKFEIELDSHMFISSSFMATTVFADFGSPVLWDLGHELFNSTPATFPVAFLAGDAFDPAFLEPFPPLTPSSDVPG